MKHQVVQTYFADNTLFADKEVNLANSDSIFRTHLKKHGPDKRVRTSCFGKLLTGFQDYLLHKASGKVLEEKHLSIEKIRFKEWGTF
ncbi:MAG: hypothetical protein PW786_06440 [Arachidicoccus sp.]|nr:hypothetical protein [Arachidicoccus sp.]